MVYHMIEGSHVEVAELRGGSNLFEVVGVMTHSYWSLIEHAQ